MTGHKDLKVPAFIHLSAPLRDVPGWTGRASPLDRTDCGRDRAFRPRCGGKNISVDARHESDAEANRLAEMFHPADPFLRPRKDIESVRDTL